MAKAFSIEDGNLQTASLTVAKTNVFKDIDLTFTNKQSGEIYKKEDAAAVKQSLKNLILTNRFEKPFASNFGGDLRSQLFELNNSLTGFRIRERIIKQIQRYEPRARVQKLIVRPIPDTNDLYVYLEARVLNASRTLVSVETSITRYR